MRQRSFRRRMTHISTLAITGLFVLVSCGGESAFPSDSLTIVANSDLAIGKARLQVGVVHPVDGRLGGPDTPISVEISPSDANSNAATYPAEWLWLIPEVTGLYFAEVELPTSGLWDARVVAEGSEVEPTTFLVNEKSIAPNIGDLAPIAPIETLADNPIDELTTDPDPDLNFYRWTMEEAFTSGKKTVVVFSTPAFCQSATCGPTLDIVKQAAVDFPSQNFIHVEVYTDINAPNFTPTAEFLNPALGPDYWNLPSEPWVFVVDEQGVVIARFEGALTTNDVVSALG